MSIKFFGGVALLVSGVTGPTIAVIPQLFQQAGWLTYVSSLVNALRLNFTFIRPTIAFILITILSGSAALFLVESMASISGNEKFQASIEYSTLAELYLGNRWHWALQIVLYIALQSQAITSLIESFQVTHSYFFVLTKNLIVSEHGYASRHHRSQVMRYQFSEGLGMWCVPPLLSLPYSKS